MFQALAATETEEQSLEDTLIRALAVREQILSHQQALPVRPREWSDLVASFMMQYIFVLESYHSELNGVIQVSNNKISVLCGCHCHCALTRR